MIVIFLAIFYSYLTKSKLDTSSFISTRTISRFRLTGDYRANITVKNALISYKETMHFKKLDLDTAIANQYKFKADATGYGGGDSIKTHDDSANYLGNYRNNYLDSMKQHGWSARMSNGDFYFSKYTNLPFHAGLLEKTKNVVIPLLFASPYNLQTHSAGPKVASAPPSGVFVDYVSSKDSRISVIAPEGMVQEIFPKTEGQKMLDTANNEIFEVDPQRIAGLAADSISSSSVNLKLLNPSYNNVIGNIVKDWSLNKILSWTILALIALLSDKIKEKVLKPLVNKFLPPKLRDV